MEHYKIFLKIILKKLFEQKDKLYFYKGLFLGFPPPLGYFLGVADIFSITSK